MNKDNKKLVIFDFDGTILDSFDILLGIERDSDHPHLTPDELRGWFDGNPNVASGHTPDHVRNIFAQYEEVVSVDAVFPKMMAVLKKASETYRLAIVSSTPEKTIENILSRFKMRSLFFDVIGREGGGPKTDKILRLLKSCSTQDSDALFITDTLGDIKQARAAGVDSVGVTWGFHDKAKLLTGKPFAIVFSPEGILSKVDEYFSSR